MKAEENAEIEAIGETYLKAYGELERGRTAGIPEDPADLLGYISLYVGVTIPYKRICEEHNAPAEYIIESVYGRDWLLVLGPRGGGKTFDAGISVGLGAYHTGLPERILGGSSDQSQRMYESFLTFLASGFGDRVVGEPMKKKTLFVGGNDVSILVQSDTSVRGVHVPRLFLDEVEDFDWDIYQTAMGIPQAKEGERAKTDVLSTRHIPGGIMSRLWANWPGRKIIWCIWEVLENCRDWSCSTCPLTAAGCPGKEKLKEAVGFYKVEDAIDKFKFASKETWNNEFLCKEPRIEGKVYEEWGKENVGEVPYDSGLPTIRSFDPGQTVVLWIQMKKVKVNSKDATQYRIIAEKRWAKVAPSRMLREFLGYEEARKWEIKETYNDPAAAWFTDELEEAGIEVESVNNSVMEGVGKVRDLIEGRTDDGEALVIADKDTCTHFIWEMEHYVMANGKIVKKHDHGNDALRYPVASGASAGETTYIRTM